MSNSKLVNYTKLSPNYNRRNDKIRKITIHHMAGNLSVETCGRVFQDKGREASSNYGIDSKGRVGLYVEEKNRSWASSSPSNDHQAVTIEVADDKIGGKWHSSDKAMAKLVDLCVDICKRNGIKKLNYTGNASGNLTMHCYFAPTTCPAPFLKSKFPWIAKEVNKRLADDKPDKKVLNVDGDWGKNTTLYTQKALGTKQDGIVSSQPKANKKYLPNANTKSWKFVSVSRGSNVVRAIQRLVGAKVDGKAGYKTVVEMQEFLKKKKLYDGKIDGHMGSQTVKAWQKYINSKF